MTKKRFEQVKEMAVEYSKLSSEQRKQFIRDNKLLAQEVSVIMFWATKIKSGQPFITNENKFYWNIKDFYWKHYGRYSHLYVSWDSKVREEEKVKKQKFN